MNPLRLLFQIILVAVLLAGGAGVMKRLANMREEPERAKGETLPTLVEVATARGGSHRFSVRAHGSVRPRVVGRISSEVSGRVVSVTPNLVAGGSILAGEELLRIEDVDYRLAAAQAEFELARAERGLALEVADAEVSVREWERGHAEAPSALTRREPQLREARAAVSLAEESLARANRDLERTVVRAPYDALVQREAVSLGDLVQRGVELAQVYQQQNLEVELPLADWDLTFLDLSSARGQVAPEGLATEQGPRVEFVSEVGGHRYRYRGRIVRLLGERDPMSRMLMAVATVEEALPTLDGRGSPAPLTPGQFVEANIEGREVEGVVSMPRSALRRGGECLVVDAEGLVEIRYPEVLRKEGEMVILTGGVSAGERVVTSRLEVVSEGMRVRVAGLHEREELR